MQNRFASTMSKSRLLSLSLVCWMLLLWASFPQIYETAKKLLIGLWTTWLRLKSCYITYESLKRIIWEGLGSLADNCDERTIEYFGKCCTWLLPHAMEVDRIYKTAMTKLKANQNVHYDTVKRCLEAGRFVHASDHLQYLQESVDRKISLEDKFDILSFLYRTNRIPFAKKTIKFRIDSWPPYNQVNPELRFSKTSASWSHEACYPRPR